MGLAHNRPMIAPSSNVPTALAGGWRHAPRLSGLLVSAALTAVAALVCYLLRGALPTGSIALLFLLAVLLSAVRDGFWTGVAASVLAFCAYNFFFVEPRYSFSVSDPEDAIALGVFLAVAALTGFLTGRVREEADAASQRAGMLEHLARFESNLQASASADDIRPVVLRHLAGLDGGAAILLRPDGKGGLILAQSVPEGLELDAPTLQAAERASRKSSAEARAAAGWEGSRYDFLPFGDEGEVVGYRPLQGQSARYGAQLERLRRTIVRQGELAMDRARLAGEAEEARARAERETVRAALLASLSHDLRTPLATILGGVTSLRELGPTLSDAARADLLMAVEEETRRLSRYVGDLLGLTRLKAGASPRRGPVDLREIARGAVERARATLPAGARLGFVCAQELPLIRADATLLEQAVFNLIDNAVKYGGTMTEVAVVAGAAGILRVEVGDDGPGIAADELNLVFEPFFRGSTAEVSGTGLGLAIAAGIVKSQGGRLEVESPLAAGHGTRMTIVLPLVADAGL